jgi:UDPglucose--hexose-1-phosphate uridylyltransferase
MSEIRYDRLHDCHVIIAPERLHRPECYMQKKRPLHHVQKCPFCEGNEALTPPEIFAIRKAGSFANERGWKTRVVPNLYKAVQIETPNQDHYGLFEYHEGFGAHEVIIDTPEHRTSMTQWSEEEAVNWLKTLGARVADLRKDTRIAHISLFKNEGAEAGATQPHVHTQLIGLPVVPKVQRERFARAARHFQTHKKALMSTIIEHEESIGERIVGSAGDFTAFCPYASAYPFEVIIAAKTLREQIDTLDAQQIATLAPLLLKVMTGLEHQLGCSVFNLEIATPPLRDDDEHDLLNQAPDICRFMIRIMPRIYRLGGFEVATQMIINPVRPEQAAKLLRDGVDA